MTKKAIIFDLDGTAVDSPIQKLPPEGLVQQIQRLKDQYYFCAATGRVWSFAKPVLQALQLTDPCIISAGTQICNPSTGEIVWQKNLEQRSLDEAISVFKQYPNWKLLCNDYTEDDYYRHEGLHSPLEFSTTEPVYFLEQVFVPDDIAKEIHSKLMQVSNVAVIMVTAQKPGYRDFHVINASATKEHAIAELLKLLKVDRKDSIGIGDGYNDMHLFNAVDYKVAMGNAVPKLKQSSDTIIKSVSEDGLTQYLGTL